MTLVIVHQKLRRQDLNEGSEKTYAMILWLSVEDQTGLIAGQLRQFIYPGWL